MMQNHEREEMVYETSICLSGTLKSMSFVDPILQDALVDTILELGEKYEIKRAYVGVCEIYLESLYPLHCLESFKQKFIAHFHRNLWSKIAKEDYSIVYVDDSPYHSHASISAENMLRLPIMGLIIKGVKPMLFSACKDLNLNMCEYLYYWRFTDPRPVPVFGSEQRLPDNSKFEKQDLTKIYTDSQLKGIVIDFLLDEPNIKNYE